MNEFAKTARRGCATLFAVSCAAAMLPMAAYTTSLPDGYIKLDYIESTYKQAIRTGYTPTYGDRIECVVKLPTSRAQQQSWPTLFGTRTSSEAQKYFFRYRPSDDSFRFGHGSTEVETVTGENMDTGGYETGHVMRVICQTNVLSWARLDGTHGGQIVASGSAPSISVPLSIFCCGHGDVTWASGGTNMRLYSFTVSNAAGVTQCDFVPCRRKSDGAVGLYDTVRGRFYGNESSNSFAGFTAAPVSSTLPDGYTRLAYIESTYKQALHTGYIPTWGDKIECDVKISNKHASSYLTLFGKQDDTSVNCYYFTIQTDATQGIGFGNRTYFDRTGEYFRTACDYLKGYDGGHLVHLTMQTNKVEWVRHDGTMYGSVYAPADATPPTMNREFCIFGGNHQDNKWVTNPTNMRLYSFKVTAQDGTVQCEFIPCRRNSDGAIGLYDVVRDLFKQNESTASGAGGPFAAGHVYGSLPLGFRKANYIESTSALQYIDTCYLHGTNDLVVMEYYAPKDWQTNGYCYLWGSKATGNTEPENWQFYIGGRNQDYVSYNHKASKATTNPATYDYTSDPIHLECQANSARWTCGVQNGSYETASSYSDWTNGRYTMYIFSGNVAGSVGGSFCTVMRLYSFKIYRDIGGEMVLVHDFVPMVAASGAVGLYDMVGDRFHGNMRANAEDFNAGIDYDSLPDGYTKAKWIQSTSDLQYIDTGYWHGTNDLVVMDYYAPRTWQVKDYCYLWGSRMGSSGNHQHAVNWSFYIGGRNQSRVNYNHYNSKGDDNPTASVYNYADNPIHLECQASTAKWTCGDVTNSFTTTGTFANWTDGKWPLYIFTGDCGGSPENSYSTIMRLYYFKIYRDIGGQMVLVRDFVPCLNESGAAGLFDKVERRFHG
ncbi:MAG: hypothetical protein IJG13_20890, partial [Kiritimatiellae bacterium]|nr:hypothetical protein [Kiritimatiellia bacterium]